MPLVYHLKYRDGRVEDLPAGLKYYYVLAPDHLLCFSAIPAWCHHCSEIKLAENLQDAAQIEAELEQVKDPKSEWYARLSRPPLPDEIALFKSCLKNQLKLLSRRTAPPRCLTCSKSQISYFAEGWSPHPDTGEEVLFSCDGIASVLYETRYFDLEGIELSPTPEQREHFGDLLRASKAESM